MSAEKEEFTHHHQDPVFAHREFFQWRPIGILVGKILVGKIIVVNYTHHDHHFGYTRILQHVSTVRPAGP